MTPSHVVRFLNLYVTLRFHLRTTTTAIATQNEPTHAPPPGPPVSPSHKTQTTAQHHHPTILRLKPPTFRNHPPATPPRPTKQILHSLASLPRRIRIHPPGDPAQLPPLPLRHPPKPQQTLPEQPPPPQHPRLPPPNLQAVQLLPLPQRPLHTRRNHQHYEFHAVQSLRTPRSGVELGEAGGVGWGVVGGCGDAFRE